MNETRIDFQNGIEQAWNNIVTSIPRFLAFLAILIIGYYVAKLLCKVCNNILERVGFDRMVERGGVKRAMDRTRYDASDILSKVIFYTVFLFVLQLAFGVFGPNPISELLTRIIAYLPNIFVAIVIVIVAAAIAAGVKDIVRAMLGGLTYGRFMANAASIAILTVGLFAALSQLNIAPAIVNGLFYAILAVFAGSAIIAIGGGGIKPMQAQWERMMGKVQQEAPRIKSELEKAPERTQQQVHAWESKAKGEMQGQQNEPRRYTP